MISPTQSESMVILGSLLELSPEVRIGQLLAHLGFLGEDQAARSLWEIEDEQFLAVLKLHHAELAARQAKVPSQPLQPAAGAAARSQPSAAQ